LPSVQRQEKRIRAIYIVVGLPVVGGVSVGLPRLKPAAPTVERAVVWPDTVKRGNISARGARLGTTPEDIRFRR
jgi:HlyD family secretion protein